MHWRLYAEEGLARYEVALWVSDDALSVEFAGEPLARYAISLATGAGKAPLLQEVNKPQLFVTRHRSPQLRLFGLEETLGESGWLKALRTAGYAPQADRHLQGIQESLFPHWMGLPG